MSFKAPPFSQYFGSLMLAALACIAVYFILVALGITDFTYALAVGLVTGHFLGSFMSSASPSSSSATGADETTSLYIGNLAYRAQREDLQQLFSPFGKVHSVRIMSDRNTRKPRGYGFVEMDSKAAAQAIKKLDNTECFGRTLRVSAAKQKPDD